MDLCHQLNANTLYGIAHDKRMSEEDRKRLIAQLLSTLSCDGMVDGRCGRQRLSDVERTSS
ncbi:MAG TPA: hypothetical protein VFF87_05310 [Hyphomicrobium sp.]|nr:hypothetical protein [Hyphomicrobium sp.]